MYRLCIVLLAVSYSMRALAQEQQLIAASQAEASAVFFNVAEPGIPVITTGDFRDDRECVVRNGLPYFFRRASQGKPLKIAYLGGSITRSNLMYRMQSSKFIQSMFPNAEMKGINAGVSGTDADLGACRLYEHVLKYKPDLLFIEFAVNGGFVQGVEGIIRQTRKYNPEIDICLIYTVTSKQLKEYEIGQVPEGIQKLDIIARHYSIPSIHMAMEAAALAKSGKLVEKGDAKLITHMTVFSQDGVHPSEEGGNLYASAIARSMLKMQKSRSTKQRDLPAALYAGNWEDAKMLSPEEVAKFSKGWTKENPEKIGFSRYKEWFPYLMKAEEPGQSFSFKFKGSMFGFFDIGGPEAGQLEMLIDGQPVGLRKKGTNLYHVVKGKADQLNRFNVFCNNRYRGQFICIELTEGSHQIEFKISREIPDKKGILGKNQLEDITANPEKYNRSVIYLGKILMRGTPIK